MASTELTQLSTELANNSNKVSTIPVEALNSAQKPLVLGNTTESDLLDRNSLLMESQNAIDQISGDLTRTRDKMSSEEEAAKRLISDLGQRDDYTAKLEDAYGLSDLESKLSGISSQISAENRLAPARLLAAEKDAEGTGLTMASLSTRLSNRERDNAIRSLTLAAEADIIQGRVQAAEARINRAVDAKFKPMEAELDLRKFNLDRIDQMMTRTEAKLSAEQQRKYDQQKSKIEKDEADLAATKQGIQAISTTIAKNGAPQAAINGVLQATTVEDAIKAAGQYLQDPMLQLDMELRRQQIVNAKVDNQVKLASLEAARNAANGKTDKDGNPLVSTPDGKLMTESEYEAAQELVNALNEVKNSDKKGMGALGIAWSHIPLVKSASKDYRKDLERLKGLLTLDDTDKLTGVLSESDMALLRSSASTLSLDQTGSAFDGELARITTQLEQSLGKQFVSDPYGMKGNTSQGVNQLVVTDDGMITLPGVDTGTASGGQSVSDEVFWANQN